MNPVSRHDVETMKATDRFLHLPDRVGNAAENMAVDFLLLKRLPEDAAACFRHYDWRHPAFTFGYSQKHASVAGLVPPAVEICRRPGGGGLVDHTGDWTYALVVSRHQDLWKLPAPQSYRSLHEALRDALAAQGVPAALQGAKTAKEAPSGICFVRPEPDDVVLRPHGGKVAGAALKRNRQGLLFQGSVSKRPLEGIDWDRFHGEFVQNLATLFDWKTEQAGFPDWDAEEEMALIDQFSSEEWNQRR